MSELDQALADLDAAKKKMDSSYDQMRGRRKPVAAQPQDKVYDNLKEYYQIREQALAGKIPIVPNQGVPNPPAAQSAEPVGEIRNAPNLWQRILERSGIVTDPKVWKQSPVGSALQTGLGAAGSVFSAPAEVIDTAAEAMGRQRPVSPDLRTPGGTPSMSIGEMATNLYPAKGVVKKMGNPVLEKVLQAAKAPLALPPARFPKVERVPEFRTASGLEGPLRPPQVKQPPMAVKPTIRINTKQAEESVLPKPPVRAPRASRRAVLKPQATPAPKESFDVFIKDSVGQATPEVLQQLKTAYDTKGKEGAIDLAIELASQGKLTVR